MNRSSIPTRGTLQVIARRAMVQRGLLPDFSSAVVAETDAIAGAAVETDSSIRDLSDLLWCSIDNDDSRCAFCLTHPGIQRTGCGRSSGASGFGPERHPAWTHVFRVEFQTPGGGRPRNRVDRPTGATTRGDTARRSEGSYAAWRVYR